MIPENGGQNCLGGVIHKPNKVHLPVIFDVDGSYFYFYFYNISRWKGGGQGAVRSPFTRHQSLMTMTNVNGTLLLHR